MPSSKLFSSIASPFDSSGNLPVPGQILLSDGTVGAPSLAFRNATDMGLYRTGASSFGVSCAGESVAIFSNTQVVMRGANTAPFVVTGGIGNSTGIQMYQDGSANGSIISTANASLFLGTNSAVNVTISNAGVVTIGTASTTPTHALNINTAATASAGAATLPANPVGFVVFNINGTNRTIPYYAT